MRFSFQNENEIQLSNCEKSPTFSFYLEKNNLYTTFVSKNFRPPTKADEFRFVPVKYSSSTV